MSAADLRGCLESSQVAIGTPGRAEVVASTMMTWIAENPAQSVVQVDLKNAYGRALQSSMLSSTARQALAVAHIMAT